MFKLWRRVFQILCLTLPLIFSNLAGASRSRDPWIEKIIQAMTLEEKVDFIGGYRAFHIRGYEHLGIPEIHMADGPVGVRNLGKSTAYPASITLAASWDKDMAYNVGKAIGCEARAKNVHMVLGPGMNIYRMPICGRNFEYLGEDPCLAGQMAAAYTRGMQDQGVIATAKHFVANNQEFNRHHCSSDMDERTLHEIYLPAFKAAVKQGMTAAVMTSYNLINGIHASEHPYLIHEILKSQWGFEGFVVSDWVSTYDGPACAKAGLDLEMPSGAMMNRETLIPAIQSGEMDVSVIDEKIRRILTVYKRFGFFENPDISKGYELDTAFVRETAIDAARGGMVLLKNQDYLLPLNPDRIRSIAIIGPNGHPAVTGGGGSSYTNPLHPLSLVEAVRQVAGDQIEVVYEKGIVTGLPFPEDIFEQSDFYVYRDGKRVTGVDADFFRGKALKGEVIRSHFYQKLDLADGDFWNLESVPETNFSVRFTGFYTPKESGFYCIGARGDDGYRIQLDGVEIVGMWRDQGPAPAKYEGFMNGGQEYKIEVEFYQSGGGAVIQLGVKKVDPDKTPEQYTKQAVMAARTSELVIMAVGFSNVTESESFDRTFEMPHEQNALINLIAETNDNIIVVLNAGGNVEMSPWIDHVKGLLMAWYPGQEGNLAAAEILFGKTNPSGKLPASFAFHLEDDPCYDSYFDADQDLRVFYDEGIFMGYRHWDHCEKKLRFPFGTGLSYTTFEYSNIISPKSVDSIDEAVQVKVQVKNTGVLKGEEIVQLYVADKVCSFPRPVKELKAFEKVDLDPGENKTVTFKLNRDAFSFYNPESHAWEVEPGEFEILIGASSADIQQTAPIFIH